MYMYICFVFLSSAILTQYAVKNIPNRFDGIGMTYIQFAISKCKLKVSRLVWTFVFFQISSKLEMK